MNSSSNSIRVFLKPIDIVESMNTISLITVASRPNWEIVQNNYLDAHHRAMLLINWLFTQLRGDSLSPIREVV